MQFGSAPPEGKSVWEKENGPDCPSILSSICLGLFVAFAMFKAARWTCVWVSAHVCIYSYVQTFWGVLYYLLVASCQYPAWLSLPLSINSFFFSLYTHKQPCAHSQPATLSLRRRCEGIAAKVLKMLLSIKSLGRRHRAPLLLFMSSLWLISSRVFTREEIQILPPAQSVVFGSL